jgi:hypothetical protein
MMARGASDRTEGVRAPRPTGFGDQRALITSGPGGDGSGLSRRRFLIGTGITLAALSRLAPPIAEAATPDEGGVAGSLLTGISDDFAALARARGSVLSTFDQLSQVNAGVVRFPVRWDQVQVDRRTLDWSGLDALHRQLVWYGQKALPVVIGCPEWISAHERKSAGRDLSYPTGGGALNAFGEFCVEVLRYFSRLGDHVEGIEIWSEPNAAGGALIDDPREYSRMLASAAMYVASANSRGEFAREMRVVSGGLGMGSPDAWKRYLEGFQGRQQLPWAVGVHAHGIAQTQGRDAHGYAEAIAASVGRALEEVAAETDADIWVTETAASSGGPGQEAGQAAALRTVTTVVADQPRCRAIIVGPLYPRTAANAAVAGQVPTKSSLLNADGTAKRAFIELAAAWQDSAA